MSGYLQHQHFTQFTQNSTHSSTHSTHKSPNFHPSNLTSHLLLSYLILTSHLLHTFSEMVVHHQKCIPMVIFDADTNVRDLSRHYLCRNARFGSGLTTGALKSDHLSSGDPGHLSKASRVLLNSIGRCPSLRGEAMLLAYEWNPKCFRWPWHALWQACETYCYQCELI